MKIKDTFKRDIARSINGVIKADQLEESDVWQELDEFVLTRELKAHLDQLIGVLVSSLDGSIDATNSNGIWVSGFFGSGKSHFIKVLSYLLRNDNHHFQGQSRHAVDFFAEKLDDKLVYADLCRVVDAGIDPILFNIDTKASHRTGRDAILQVFLKVLNEHQGYSSDHPHIAHMERYLDGRGLLAQFHDAFERASGQPWVAERDAWEFMRDELIAALSETLDQTPESVERWVEGGEESFSLSAENLAKWVKAWLDTQPNDRRLMFLVDELGQFIGGDTHLMLNLQTIAEQLGTVCGGRSWIVVTSQEDLDAVLGGDQTVGKQNDFSKIQGRFRTRLSLSSANVDEVIKRRLLDKRTETEDTLAAAYSGREDILRNQLSFSATGATFKNYTGVDDFSECYPFAAYQFFLVQKVFESIRRAGVTGLHLSQGERSTLDAFQNAAKHYADAEIGSLVPFGAFYPSVEGFLDTAVKRTIEQAADNTALKSGDITVLKVLFLIRYVDELPGTLDNLLVLLTDGIDADRVSARRDTEESLKRLESETLIARSDDRYFFLTNEEQDIGREIKNTTVLPAQESRELARLLFDEVLGENSKHTYTKTGRVFSYGRLCDETVHGAQSVDGLEVALLTPNDGERYDDFREDSRCILHTAEHGHRLLIRLPDQSDAFNELRVWLQTDTYLKNRGGARLEKSTERILEDRTAENRTRRQRLVEQLGQTLDQASAFACGQAVELKSKDAKGALGEGLDYLISNAYTKMGLISHPAQDARRELQTLLRADDIQSLDLDGDAANPHALEEMRAYLNIAEHGARKVILSELVERYGRAPYGWLELETVLLVARLAVLREIELIVDAAPLTLDKAYSLLEPVRARSRVIIKRREKADSGLIKQLQKLGLALFGKSPPSGEADLEKALRDQLEAWKNQVSTYLERARAGGLPGEEDLQTGQTLLDGVLRERVAGRFLSRLKENAGALEDFREDYTDLHTFHTNQLPLWRVMSDVLDDTRPNERQLANDEGAVAAFATLTDIASMQRPYARLHEVTPLAETLRAANASLIEQSRAEGRASLKRLGTQLAGEIKHAGIDTTAGEQLTAPLQKLAETLERETSIAHIEQLSRDGDGALESALQEIERLVASRQAAPVDKPGSTTTSPAAAPIPKPRRTIRPAEAWAGEPLETQADIDAYLDTLRVQLQQAIDAGERVWIK